MVSTRPVNSELFRNYIQKSEECFNSAKDSFQKSQWNSAVINAIHCGICAADALTVLFKGERCSGERHTEVLTLLKEIEVLHTPDFSKKMNQFNLLIDMKNRAEYEEYLMSASDAESTLKAAERFLTWVKQAVNSKI